MFDSNSLGALAVGGLFVWGLQLSGVTGLDHFEDQRMAGAKFVTVEHRRAHDPMIEPTSRLDQFAGESVADATVFEKAMVLWDQTSETFRDTSRTVIIALID